MRYAQGGGLTDERRAFRERPGHTTMTHSRSVRTCAVVCVVRRLASEVVAQAQFVVAGLIASCGGGSRKPALGTRPAEGVHLGVVGGLQILRGRQRGPVDLLLDGGDRFLGAESQ